MAEQFRGALRQSFHLGALRRFGAGNGDADDAGARQRFSQRQGEAGVGAGAA
ncbi:hypothetical protein D3C80_2037710 [compost metagenome]